MAQQAPPRVSFSDKDLENGAPNNDRAASRKWSTAPGNIEDLDEYTALQKYISTYRDPKSAEAAEDKPVVEKKGFFGKKKAVAVDDGVVPEELLEADIKQGISNHDVETRRKRYGWNEISTEKENLFLKFLGFFTGPILYSKFFYIISPPAAAGFASSCACSIVLCVALLRAKQLSPQLPAKPPAPKSNHGA
jgi:H+-transporting ATPase